MRNPGPDASREAVHAEAGHPRMIEAGGPVPAVQSVLGAGEDREPLVDVVVELVELPPGVAVAEVVGPAPQRGVEALLNDQIQRQPRVAAVCQRAYLASNRGHRPR